jgi:predicted DNA-binding protein
MAVKIKLEADLYERVKKVAGIAGYATPEEFIVHMIEKELAKLEDADDADVTERLRGLGYIE